jgi:hypothetical protein
MSGPSDEVQRDVLPIPDRPYEGEQHRRGAHLGEPMGRGLRVGGAALRRTTDRQRTDSDPGDHRLHRGRRRTDERRRMRCPEESTRGTSGSHRRAGGEDRSGGQGRHTRPRAGREDRSRGRGRHTRPAGSPPPNLVRRWSSGDAAPRRGCTGPRRIRDLHHRRVQRSTRAAAYGRRAPAPSSTRFGSRSSHDAT